LHRLGTPAVRACSGRWCAPRESIRPPARLRLRMCAWKEPLPVLCGPVRIDPLRPTTRASFLMFRHPARSSSSGQMAPGRAILLLVLLEAIHVSCFTPSAHPSLSPRTFAISKPDTRHGTGTLRRSHARSLRAGPTAVLEPLLAGMWRGGSMPSSETLGQGRGVATPVRRACCCACMHACVCVCVCVCSSQTKARQRCRCGGGTGVLYTSVYMYMTHMYIYRVAAHLSLPLAFACVLACILCVCVCVCVCVCM